MKRLLSLTLLVCLISATVHASTTKELSLAFKHFQTQMDLWDSVDQKKMEEAKAKFRKKIQDLHISAKELMEFTISEIENKKAANELRKTYQLIQFEELEKQEAMDLVLKRLSTIESEQGANWSLHADFGMSWLIPVIAITLGITLGVVGISTQRQPDCYEDYFCYGTYVDPWGNECEWQLQCR